MLSWCLCILGFNKKEDVNTKEEDTDTTSSQRKMSIYIFGFHRKLAGTKTQQSTDKASKYNGRTVFMYVSTCGVNFVFYLLSSIYITYSLFAPTSLFESIFATDRVRHPPIVITTPPRFSACILPFLSKA